MSRIVVRAIASCSPTADDQGVTIATHIPNSQLEIYVDESRIIQALCYILCNAIKYSDAGSNVLIKGYVENGIIWLEVLDKGCGIASENISRIFCKLYQVNECSSGYSGGGLGLGLSISKRIISLHGGNILVESDLGKGTIVRVCLPLYDKK